MRNVAFVPERDVFQRGDGVAAQHAREAGETFPGDGIAFVRHGARTFLASGERLFGFENFGALQMAEFDGPTLDARADEGECGLEFSVEVALHDLRGDGRGTQAELFADKIFHTRRQVRASSDGTGKFADGNNFAGAFKTFERPTKFVVHQSHFQTERRRLGVDAVTATNAGREFMLLRAAGNDRQQRLHVGDQNVRALHHLHGEAGVHDVATREAEVQPAAGTVVDLFGDGGGETDDV